MLSWVLDSDSIAPTTLPQRKLVTQNNISTRASCDRELVFFDIQWISRNVFLTPDLIHQGRELADHLLHQAFFRHPPKAAQELCQWHVVSVRKIKGYTHFPAEQTEQTQTKAQPNTNTSWIVYKTKHLPTVLYLYLMAVYASVFALVITAFEKACEFMRATLHQKHDKKKVSDRPFIFKCDPIFSESLQRHQEPLAAARSPHPRTE